MDFLFSIAKAFETWGVIISKIGVEGCLPEVSFRIWTTCSYNFSTLWFFSFSSFISVSSSSRPVILNFLVESAHQSHLFSFIFFTFNNNIQLCNDDIILDGWTNNFLSFYGEAVGGGIILNPDDTLNLKYAWGLRIKSNNLEEALALLQGLDQLLAQDISEVNVFGYS